MLYIIIHYNL